MDFMAPLVSGHDVSPSNNLVSWWHFKCFWIQQTSHTFKTSGYLVRGGWSVDFVLSIGSLFHHFLSQDNRGVFCLGVLDPTHSEEVASRFADEKTFTAGVYGYIVSWM